MGKITKGSPRSIGFSVGLFPVKFAGVILIALTVLSCTVLPVRETRPRGVYHRVKSGETLSMIARAYRVDIQELAEINNIENPERIEADSVIFVPEASRILDDIKIAGRPKEPVAVPKEVQAPQNEGQPSVSESEISRKKPLPDGEKGPERTSTQAAVKGRTAVSRGAEKKGTSVKDSNGTEETGAESPSVKLKAGDQKDERVRFDKKRFAWPVRGKVISHFGIQANRMYFNGIRIAASEGTPVYAAADGVVIFSAPLKDYGETIIIQHDDSFATVYSHLGVRTVQGDVKVKKGSRIAFIGKADNDGESYLHFEIRHKNKARNPVFFLP